MNGVFINIIYADDTVILADKFQNLERVMNNIVRYSKNYELSNNSEKNKILEICKNTNFNGLKA